MKKLIISLTLLLATITMAGNVAGGGAPRSDDNIEIIAPK